MSITEEGCRLTASFTSTPQHRRSSTNCLELSLTVKIPFGMARLPTLTFTAPSANHRHGRCWKVASCFGRMHGFQYTMGSFAPEGARTAAFCGPERFPPCTLVP